MVKALTYLIVGMNCDTYSSIMNGLPVELPKEVSGDTGTLNLLRRGNLNKLALVRI